MGDQSSNGDDPKPPEHAGQNEACRPHTIRIKQTAPNAVGIQKGAKDKKNTPLDYLSFIVLLGAMIAAIIAAFYTAQQVSVARQTLKEVRATSRAELRAYTYVRAFPRVNNPKSPHTGLPIRNSGQTPATSLSLRAQMIIGDERAAPSPTKTVFENTPIIEIDTTLDPSTNISRFPYVQLGQPLNDDELTSMKKGSSHIFVYGVLSYRDVLNEPHNSYFCFDYAGWGPSPDTGTGTTSQHFCDAPNSD